MVTTALGRALTEAGARTDAERPSDANFREDCSAPNQFKSRSHG
jgi:hypothetical protein